MYRTGCPPKKERRDYGAIDVNRFSTTALSYAERLKKKLNGGHVDLAT